MSAICLANPVNEGNFLNLITTQEWSSQSISNLICRAKVLKQLYQANQLPLSLKRKTLFMIFFDTSTRTRASFEAAMTCLGGHAQYINAASTRLQDGEDPRDLARVYSRYGHAIGVRCTGESESNSYGNANKLLRSFAQHATVPVINMGDDMYHPCQALSDLMTVEEYSPHYRHKKFVISWAPAPMPRSLYSIHETILIMTRFGLDVTVCYPEGYDLDPTILEEAKNNSSLQGSNLTLTNNRQAALSGAHFVFPRNWLSLKDLASSPASDLQPSKKETPWTLSKKDLQLTDSSCLIMHVLPAFREWEITSELLDSPQSIVFTQAENRLYAQMALLEMLIGEGNSSALELFPDKVLAKSLIQATNCPVAN